MLKDQTRNLYKNKIYRIIIYKNIQNLNNKREERMKLPFGTTFWFLVGCLNIVTAISLESKVNFARQIEKVFQCDPRDASTCKNGGSCTKQNGNEFYCICPSGLTGFACEKTDPCSPNPCRNNGTCFLDINFNYYCKCQTNFFGVNCSFVNNCNSTSCQNGGTCRPTENS